MSGLRVLVFEADHGFAASITRAFQRRGCAVTVVDDGQVGLDLAQTMRPDLIILSIELPRMNGFAVCNRLKKNTDLKDVPLIIVSSESPQETFEQHGKLRTRAEDYAHKPISPEELIRRASAFITIPPVSADAQPVPVDDLDVEEPMHLSDVRDLKQMERSAQKLRPVDAELDGLTDAAFDHIMLDTESAPEPQPVEPDPLPTAVEPPPLSNDFDLAPSLAEDFEDFTVVSSDMAGQLKSVLSGQQAEAVTAVPAPLVPSAPPVVVIEARSDTPPARGPETEATQGRVADLEMELGTLRAALARDRDDAQAAATKADEDRARLVRELDEARAKAAAPPATPPPGAAPGRPAATGVSTREFLELREGLHRKDKEILALKESVNGREKEILELRDRVLQGERDRNELDERVLARDQELAGLHEQNASLTVDLVASEETTTSLRRDVTAANESLLALQASHDDAMVSASAELSTARAELVAVREAHTRELVAVREAQTREFAAARDAHERELAAVQADLVAMRQSHSAEVIAHASRLQELTDAHADERTAMDARMQEFRGQSEAVLRQARAEHDARIGALQAAAEQGLADAEARHERELAAAQAAAQVAAATAAASLTTVQEAHAATVAERDIKVKILEAERDAHAQAHTEEQLAHEASRGEHALVQDDLRTGIASAEARADGLSHDLADVRARLAGAERNLARQAAMNDRTRRALRVALAFVEESGRADEAQGGVASAE